MHINLQTLKQRQTFPISVSVVKFLLSMLSILHFVCKEMLRIRIQKIKYNVEYAKHVRILLKFVLLHLATVLLTLFWMIKTPYVMQASHKKLHLMKESYQK